MTDFGELFGPAAAPGRFYGVASAIVTNNKDPDGLGRVRLKLPWMSGELESGWARVASPMAGAGRGVYFLPEVDDEVLVAFAYGDPASPYVLGGLWNGEDHPPEANGDGKNDVRVIRSRNGHVIRLVDTDGDERIEIVDRSEKNSIVISTKDGTITISADADIAIGSASGKLSLSGQGVEITSKTDVKIQAGTDLALKADARLSAKGQIVNIN